jgi:hypothetical protein
MRIQAQRYKLFNELASFCLILFNELNKMRFYKANAIRP